MSFRVVFISLLALFIDNKDTDDLHLPLVRLPVGFTVGTGYAAKYPMWPAEYMRLWKDSICAPRF